MAAIWIDTVNGTPGGAGTEEDPVDSVTAAKVIADASGGRRYAVKGGSSVTWAAGHGGWVVEGVGFPLPVVDLNDAALDCEFRGVRTTGDIAATSDACRFVNCALDLLTLPGGSLVENCEMLGSFDVRDTQTPSGAPVELVRCRSSEQTKFPLTIPTTSPSYTSSDFSAGFPAWLTPRAFTHAAAAGTQINVSYRYNVYNGGYFDGEDEWPRVEHELYPNCTAFDLLVDGFENLEDGFDDNDYVANGLWVENRERTEVIFFGKCRDTVAFHWRIQSYKRDGTITELWTKGTGVPTPWSGDIIPVQIVWDGVTCDFYVDTILETTIALPSGFEPGWVGWGILDGSRSNDAYDQIRCETGTNPTVTLSYTGDQLGTTAAVPIVVTDWRGELHLKQQWPEGSRFDVYGNVYLSSVLESGTVALAGQGSIDDQSNGAVVNLDNFLTKKTVAEYVWEEEYTTHLGPSSVGLSSAVGMYMGRRGPGVFVAPPGVGTPGQVIGVNGTHANPSSDPDDAIAIADTLGLKRLYFVGDRLRGRTFSVPERSYVDWEFLGEVRKVHGTGSSEANTTLLYVNNATDLAVVSGCRFENLLVGIYVLRSDDTDFTSHNYFYQCDIVQEILSPYSMYEKCTLPPKIQIRGVSSPGQQTSAHTRLVDCDLYRDQYLPRLTIETAGDVGSYNYVAFFKLIGFRGDVYVNSSFNTWDPDTFGDLYNVIDLQGAVEFSANVQYGNFIVSGVGTYYVDPGAALTSLDTSLLVEPVAGLSDSVVGMQADLVEIQGHVGRNKVVETISRDDRARPTIQRTRLYDSGTNARLNDGSTGLVKELIEVLGVFSTISVDGQDRDVMDSFASVDTAPMTLAGTGVIPVPVSVGAEMVGAATAFDEYTYFSGVLGDPPPSDGVWTSIHAGVGTAKLDGVGSLLLDASGTEADYQNDNQIMVYHALPAGSLAPGSYLQGTYDAEAGDHSAASGVYSGVFFEDEVGGRLTTWGYYATNLYHYTRPKTYSGTSGAYLTASAAGVVTSPGAPEIANMGLKLTFTGMVAGRATFTTEYFTGASGWVTVGTAKSENSTVMGMPTRCGLIYTSFSNQADPADKVSYNFLRVGYTSYGV